ncbi:hypothetical protein [Clostridium lundense]|uniref:hypothetical protein n=1 Tax=Clostridium lundense TaxID=319475 RepID=UPI000685EA16|nr:hypothetical protein [Clostridium lundense]
MLEDDKKIMDIVNVWNGLYMRYSDDIIIILPKVTNDFFIEQFKAINNILKSIPGLKLQGEKTQIYKYFKTELASCNELVMEKVPNGQNRINYLGFTFDGKKITIRDKTITKYYYHMYRKLKTIIKHKGITKNGNRISAKNVKPVTLPSSLHN